MTRSSLFVWKQSFSNVPYPFPPECPGDLNEPQYAELMFGKACTVGRPILSSNLKLLCIINSFLVVLWKERGQGAQSLGRSSEGVHQVLGRPVRSSRIIRDGTHS